MTTVKSQPHTGAILRVNRAGPYSSVQDLGRPGYLSWGITEGGVADRIAYSEGLTLLGTPSVTPACVEIFGMGGCYEVLEGSIQACLTGAPIPATLDGQEISHRTTFAMTAGQVLDLGIIRGGNISYLMVGGGIDVPMVFGARSTHLRASIGGHCGRNLRDGDVLHVMPDMSRNVGLTLPEFPVDRRDTTRVMLSAQSHLFSDEERARFFATTFKITHELDRMGARLSFDGAPFLPNSNAPIISESIVLGDIQLMGNGQPVVLLADRQPTGGYPRIACIVRADVPSFVQKQPGSDVMFELVDHTESLTALQAQERAIASRQKHLVQATIDKENLMNLNSTNLISGAVANGEHLPWE